MPSKVPDNPGDDNQIGWIGVAHSVYERPCITSNICRDLATKKSPSMVDQQYLETQRGVWPHTGSERFLHYHFLQCGRKELGIQRGPILLQLDRLIPHLLVGEVQLGQNKFINSSSVAMNLFSPLWIMKVVNPRRYRKHPWNIHQNRRSNEENEVCLLCLDLCISRHF